METDLRANRDNASDSTDRNSCPFVLRMFGGLSLEGPNGTLTRFPTRRSALILTCLALARGQRVHRDELSETLWPDEDADWARMRLRQELLRVRQATGEFSTRLRADRTYVEIEPGSLTTDVSAFEDAIREAATAHDAQQRIRFLKLAVSIASEPLLAGQTDSWAHSLRRHYSEKVLAAWLQLGEALFREGEYADAFAANRKAVELAPLDTAAHALLVRHLLVRGHPAAARQEVVELEARLLAETGHRAPDELWSLLDSADPSDTSPPEAQRDYWTAVSEWAFTESRKLSAADEDAAFAAIALEIENLRRGIRWAMDNDPRLAAHLVLGTWRTVGARGQPSIDGDLLYRAAQIGADLLPPVLGGEALTGAAITLANAGRIADAEHAFVEAIAMLHADPSESTRDVEAWAKVNFAISVVQHSDRRYAAELLREAIAQSKSPPMKALAQMETALFLAADGDFDEAIEVGKEVFEVWSASGNKTMAARAYADLGELYQIFGQPEKARPLMEEGIRMLRDAGVQYMLSYQLVCMAKLLMAERVVDWPEVSHRLDEAAGIASRTGSRPRQLEVARLRMVQAARTGGADEFLAAVATAFKLTQFTQSDLHREQSLTLLASELEYRGHLPYANAIRRALGQEYKGPCCEEWASRLAATSHLGIGAAASQLAEEAVAQPSE